MDRVLAAKNGWLDGHITYKGEDVAPFWCDIEMTIDTNKYAPFDIFQMKDEILEQANASQEKWNTMSEEERDYHERLTREALEVLHENVAMWIPQSFVDGDDNHLGISFNIVNTEINRFIEGVKFHSEFRNENLKKDLVNLVKAVDALDDDDEDEAEEAEATTA